MTERQSKSIGSKKAITSVFVGVILFQLYMSFSKSTDGSYKGFYWFKDFEYLPNLAIGLLLSFLCAHIFGQQAGKRIIMKGKSPIFTGISTGLKVILTTAFLTGWVAFFQESSATSDSFGTRFFDFIIKPLFWTLLLGFFPVCIVGVYFGKQMARKKRDFEKSETAR